MTCIVWHKNRLYADSAVHKDGETLFSFSKIQPILVPFRIQSVREGFVFDDIVHGWSGTGAFMPMVKFVESLESDAKAKDDEDSLSNHTVLFYKLAADKDLVVSMGNLFEVLLIGEKANHSFRWDTDGFSYRRYEKTEIVCMGGGAQLCMNNIKRATEESKVDILRAMFDTFYHDTNSGGFIDIWEMIEHEKDKKSVFRRYGMHHHIPRDLLVPVMNEIYPNGKKIEATFLRRELMYAPLLGLDEENKRVTAELSKALAKIRRYEKQLGIVPKPARKKAAPKQSTSN